MTIISSFRVPPAVPGYWGTITTTIRLPADRCLALASSCGTLLSTESCPNDGPTAAQLEASFDAEFWLHASRGAGRHDGSVLRDSRSDQFGRAIGSPES